jgi:beta-carotene 3-hydroxylase
MDVSPATGLALLLATVALMEGFAYAAHRWIMHGPMWFWHASHHAERTGPFERNDRFALLFGLASCLPIFLGTQLHLGTAWTWLGLGIIVYGLIYFFFHDVLVHRRITHGIVPRSRYLRRIVQAHRLHHAVGTRDGTVSFGFLYAPPIPRLVAAMKHAPGLRASSKAPRAKAAAQG